MMWFRRPVPTADSALRIRRIVLAGALLLAAGGAVAAGQSSPPPSLPPPGGRIEIPRVEQPPTIDDYLDGVPRSQEVAVARFYQREPGDGVPVSQPTEAYLSYDDRHLYVIFVARDEPAKVRATLTKREDFGSDDFVGVMLDSFHDRRRAYLFIVNPLGVQLDGVTADGQHDDYSFDTVWSSEGRLTPFGYVVWMAIPFKSLRFANQPEQEWGVGLVRAIRRNNETAFWPYMTRRIASMGEQLATATGVRDVSPGRNIQLIPYAAGAGARFLDTSRPAYRTDTDLRGGMDGKMVLKDAFALDLTFNPDFSQVESDEPQVTINQRFEVFFPEKRPFFIENAQFYQTPFNLFFSRRVVEPQLGARITGKKAGWAVAALAIDDRAPGQRLDALDPAHGDRAGIGVVRVQREFPRQSNLGFLATTRSFGGGESHVFSVDGRYRMTDTVVLTGQAVLSQSTPFDGPSLSGPAFSLELDRSGRTWGAFLSYEDISPDFRAPLGFVRRTDLRQVHPFIRHTYFRQNSPLISIRSELSGRSLWDHAGVLQDWEVVPELEFEFTGQTEISVSVEEGMERFEGTTFRKRETQVRAGTGWLKWLELNGEVNVSNEIVYEPAEGLTPFLADATGAELSLTWRPIAPLRIDEAYLFTRLTKDNATVVENHIVRTRASYQFTRELSLRAILDYSGVLPDESRIALDREKRLTADFLVTYLLNPWTALYVGYTDGYENKEIDPLRRDRVRITDSPFHSTGRQLFVKLSYLFRF